MDRILKITDSFFTRFFGYKYSLVHTDGGVSYLNKFYFKPSDKRLGRIVDNYLGEWYNRKASSILSSPILERSNPKGKLFFRQYGYCFKSMPLPCKQFFTLERCHSIKVKI